MFGYPMTVSFDDEAGEYEISYRDFTDLYCTALTEDDVELAAKDGLTAFIAEMIESRIPIPAPSPTETDDILIHLPVLTCLKIALHNAMINTGTRKADLARKLNQKGPQIDRLLDVEHASKVETLEQALYLLGYEVSVTVAKLP